MATMIRHSYLRRLSIVTMITPLGRLVQLVFFSGDGAMVPGRSPNGLIDRLAVDGRRANTGQLSGIRLDLLTGEWAAEF
jgi:hypothetical protein